MTVRGPSECNSEGDAEHRDSDICISPVHLQSSYFSHVNLPVEILNSFLNDPQAKDGRKALEPIATVQGSGKWAGVAAC